MSCSRCSNSFENKWVQCFDEQEINMYMKSNGMVKLVHKDVIENTNFNYCPYCGEKLEGTLKFNKNLNDVKIPLLNPLIPEEPTEMQKAIKKAVEETILNNTKLNNDFIKGGKYYETSRL